MPSGQSRVYNAIAYRWRSLPRVRRHRPSEPQRKSERVLPWQVTTKQLICALLTHTHYWYEVGILKVPAHSLPADFSTKKCRLRMAHKSRPPTEAYHTQLSLCDDRNWLASGCIKHGVFQSRRSNRVTVAPHRLPTKRKEMIFLS